jgi:hypothetical protein
VKLRGVHVGAGGSGGRPGSATQRADGGSGRFAFLRVALASVEERSFEPDAAVLATARWSGAAATANEAVRDFGSGSSVVETLDFVDRLEERCRQRELNDRGVAVVDALASDLATSLEVGCGERKALDHASCTLESGIDVAFDAEHPSGVRHADRCGVAERVDDRVTAYTAQKCLEIVGALCESIDFVEQHRHDRSSRPSIEVERRGELPPAFELESWNWFGHGSLSRPAMAASMLLGRHGASGVRWTVEQGFGSQVPVMSSESEADG